jgi:hypothetical protein
MVPELWGRPPVVALLVPFGGGASGLFEGHVYFELNMAQDKIYILVCCMLV